MANVNEKGTIAEAKVLSDLVSSGYGVFTPFGDFGPVDLIVSDSSGTLRRLQVKYRSEDARSKNRVIISMRSVVNGKSIPVDRDQVDGYAVYNPELDRIFYIPMSALPMLHNYFVLRPQERKFSSAYIGDFSSPSVLF